MLIRTLKKALTQGPVSLTRHRIDLISRLVCVLIHHGRQAAFRRPQVVCSTEVSSATRRNSQAAPPSSAVSVRNRTSSSMA